MEENLKYGDITGATIGCAMKVHQKMKNGFAESIYQRCLAIGFEKRGLNFLQEREINIFYEGVWVGKRRVDFLIEEKIVVEIKALAELTDAHLAQALNYLEAHDLEIGLLINFGAKSLQFKRLINQHKLHQQKHLVNPLNPRS